MRSPTMASPTTCVHVDHSLCTRDGPPLLSLADLGLMGDDLQVAPQHNFFCYIISCGMFQ